MHGCVVLSVCLIRSQIADELLQILHDAFDRLQRPECHVKWYLQVTGLEKDDIHF